MKKTVLSLIVIWPGIMLCAQDPGDLYTEFSHDGYFLENWTDTSTLTRDIAVRADGSPLVAGEIRNSQTNSFVLMMDQLGNSISSTITRGYERNVTDSPDEGAGALYTLPDGKTLVAGYYMGLSYHPYIIRLEADGSLDESFGTHGIFDGASINMDVLDMDVYFTGGGSYKIAICGTRSDHYPQVAMVTDDGTLDTQFGLDGAATLLDTEGSYKSITVDSKNHVLYATGIIGDRVGTIIAKYDLPLGKLNNDFGSDGVLIYPETVFFGGPLAHVLDKSDNTLTVFGGYRHAAGDYDIFAFRMNALNGNADPSFGNAGWAYLRIPVEQEEITSAVLQADGKYCFSGNYSSGGDVNAFAGRINHNGTPDGSFGTNGLVLFPAPNPQYVYGIALSPRENIVYIAGTQNNPMDFSMFLIALHTGFETEPEEIYYPIVVTNTGDGGPGSLREAIHEANEHAGPDTILFNISLTDPEYNPVTGVCKIRCESQKMQVDDDSTVIDGTSQTVNQGNTNISGPEIEVTGSDVCDKGLVLHANYAVIRGLVINRFTLYGISISGHHNHICGNYIGTDPTGTLAKPNEYGIQLGFASTNCLIGGSAMHDRNLISGNNRYGIFIVSDGTDCNKITGNYIGTDRTGELTLGNIDGGIELLNGPSDNIIGGAEEADRNIISGNSGTESEWSGNGIFINGADSNIVTGNFIGTNKNASLAVPNMGYGIFINNGDHNIIGSTEAGNVISGNVLGGIYLFSNSDSNQIAGNFIGTELSGLSSIPNGNYGMYLYYEVRDNMIGPENTIVNNGINGIYCRGENTIFNTITRNFIAYNGASEIRLDNGANQLLPAPRITDVSSEAITGRTCPECLVEIFSDETSDGGNFEGSTLADASGNFTWFGTAAGSNITATATDSDGNTSEYCSPWDSMAVISDPFEVVNTSDSGEGSLRQAMLNAESMPGADTIFFNIPESDPGYDSETGVWRIMPDNDLPPLNDHGTVIDATSQTLSQGDVNIKGPEVEINGRAIVGTGLVLSGNNITIKGLAIYGFYDSGIAVFGHRNSISGNYIGCSANGNRAIPNGYGISVSGGAKHTYIGGAGADHNLISGNANAGIGVFHEGTDSTVIVGNYIGTDYLGMDTLCNGYIGIHLANRSGYTKIGGSLPGLRNLICGSKESVNLYTGNGITIERSDNNTVQGNYIGLGNDGTTVLSNTSYGILLAASMNNLIGGSESGEGNVISGNGTGIYIRFGASRNNNITGNFIGTDATGQDSIGNTTGMILDYGASENHIGPSNIIMYNETTGIYCSHDSTIRNTISRNAIAGHSGPGILTEEGANHAIPSPEVTDVAISGVTGTSCAGCIVEIFSDDADEGAIFEGSTTADVSGQFSWTGTVTGPYVTATATDSEGNTSQFSSPFEVSSAVPVVPGENAEITHLAGNVPNPFRNLTNIIYHVGGYRKVTLSILDLSGHEVIRLVNAEQTAGDYTVSWNGCDSNGNRLNPGIYFCSLNDGTKYQIIKLAYLGY